MISILPKEPDYSVKLTKEVWTALAHISWERQKSPEELIEIWVARYIQNKEAIAQEEARQKGEAKE